MARPKRIDQEPYNGAVAVSEAPLLEPTATLPAKSDTLAEILDDLLAYQETLEIAETEEARQEITAIIAERQSALITKVDRFAAVMRRVEHEIAWEESEAKRHVGRRKRFEAVLDRMASYAIATMHDKNVSRLEGQGATLKLRAGRGSVEILDLDAVPSAYKLVTVQMPLDTWQMIIGAIPVLEYGEVSSAISKASVTAPKDPIHRAIKAGEDVPGADLVFNDSLQLE